MKRIDAHNLLHKLQKIKIEDRRDVHNVQMAVKRIQGQFYPVIQYRHKIIINQTLATANTLRVYGALNCEFKGYTRTSYGKFTEYSQVI
jgi:hypothetical protein